MSERRKSFSSEFKDEAVKMVIESSRAVADVARELGIGAETLRTWVNRYRVEHADEEPPLTISERARLRELEKENRELKMKTVGVYEAKTHLPRLLEEVRSGERITITKHGVPIALLIPAESGRPLCARCPRPPCPRPRTYCVGARCDCWPRANPSASDGPDTTARRSSRPSTASWPATRSRSTTSSTTRPIRPTGPTSRSGTSTRRRLWRS